MFMEYTKLLEKKARLQKELSVLPQGYISKKNINGKTYHYLQNRVSGKMAGIYLKKDKVDRVSEQIRLRKQYEEELPKVNIRLNELEQAARLIGHGLDRRLLLQKLGAGMDMLSAEQKGRWHFFCRRDERHRGSPGQRADLQRACRLARMGKRLTFPFLKQRCRRYGFKTEVQP